MAKLQLDVTDAFQKALADNLDKISKRQAEIAQEVARLKGDRNAEPLLEKVIINAVGDGRSGFIMDASTGKLIRCHRIELVHCAGKRPELVIYVRPDTLEYNLESLEASVVVEGAINESTD